MKEGVTSHPCCNALTACTVCHAAGLIDSFTYSPTAASTPPYFKTESMSAEEVKERNPFGMTCKKAMCMDDTLADESGFVVGFCAYDEPESDGSAMGCLAMSMKATSKDISDRLFGTSADLGVDADSSGSDDSLSGRLFGDNKSPEAAFSAYSYDTSAENLEESVFGATIVPGSSLQQDVGSCEGLTGRQFGWQSPVMHDGQEQATDDGEVEDDRLKEVLTQRLFGTQEVAAGGDLAEGDFKAELTQRLFGREQLASDDDTAPTPEGDAELKAELTQRLFGRDVAALHWRCGRG